MLVPSPVFAYPVDGTQQRRGMPRPPARVTRVSLYSFPPLSLRAIGTIRQSEGPVEHDREAHRVGIRTAPQILSGGSRNMGNVAICPSALQRLHFKSTGNAAYPLTRKCQMRIPAKPRRHGCRRGFAMPEC